jgi:chromosomal replication initiator protein
MEVALGNTEVSTELWAAVLEALEDRYSKPIFQMWLRPMRVLGLSSAEIVLSVQSKFARDYAANRLQRDIQNVLADLLGYEIAVRFVVVPDGQKTPVDNGFSGAAAPATADPARPAGGRVPTIVEDVPANNLNARYTFEEFVVGNSNRFAHAAAQAVAETPARAYNPLFLYGGVGLGKTHLMHAIGHRVMRENPRAKIVYVSSEKFTNEFIIAIKNNQTVEFRNKYRYIDLLLIDDIQFLEGKEQTLEEFFHTFNTLHEAGRQLVISSDRPPKEIQTLENRLRSRFEMGLLTDIQPPDLETREAILRKKAESEKVPVPDEVTSFIAKVIPSNIRELEGALIRVVAFASLTKAPISVELAADVLKNVIATAPQRRVTIPIIKDKVASAHGLTVKEMDHPRREARLAGPRQIAMYLACELTDNSLPRIAREFGKKDHTTVMYARDKVKEQMRRDEAYRDKVRALSSLCQNGE